RKTRVPSVYVFGVIVVRQRCETSHFSIGACTSAGKSRTPFCVASRSKRSASGRRSSEGAGKKTGRTLLRMLPTYACCRAAATRVMRPVILSELISPSSKSARFFRESHSLESKAAHKSQEELVSEFSKSGATNEGGSESMRTELVCASASDRS